MTSYLKCVKFETLKGKVFNSVERFGDECIKFRSADYEYSQYHIDDCCESVSIADICGDLSDLEGVEILEAYQDDNYQGEDTRDESFTWSFYVVRTTKGTVTIRWYGCSNGYYSETVDLYDTKVK
jgi:hypothetical protein